jgi:hypothetical protein
MGPPQLPPFHDIDLLLGQPVELVDQGVDLGVVGGDLALEQGGLGGGFGGGALAVQAEHALDQGDHVVVAFAFKELTEIYRSKMTLRRALS